MYTRASASDYDDFQAKGWTTKELIPLMKKHETYQRASQNRDSHGFEGPIKVSFGNYTYPVMQVSYRLPKPTVSYTNDPLPRTSSVLLSHKAFQQPMTYRTWSPAMVRSTG